MNKWRKSILALVVLGAVAAFGYQHSSNKTSNFNSAGLSRSSVKSLPKSENSTTPNEEPKKVETKVIAETQSVPFQSVTENDDAMPTGISKVTERGANGVKTLTYKVTYTDSVETGREKISEVITKQPVKRVTKIGIKEDDSKTSVHGPADATALCMDGFLSYADNHRGACSNHGGVRLWYR